MLQVRPREQRVAWRSRRGITGWNGRVSDVREQAPGRPEPTTSEPRSARTRRLQHRPPRAGVPSDAGEDGRAGAMAGVLCAPPAPGRGLRPALAAPPRCLVPLTPEGCPGGRFRSWRCTCLPTRALGGRVTGSGPAVHRDRRPPESTDLFLGHLFWRLGVSAQQPLCVGCSALCRDLVWPSGSQAPRQYGQVQCLAGRPWLRATFSMSRIPEARGRWAALGLDGGEESGCGQDPSPPQTAFAPQ